MSGRLNRIMVYTAIAAALTVSTGCGTTKWSDTSRTATEQLLISSAMDDVIDEFDFYPLTGRKIYIESKGVVSTDKEYLLSLLRQQLAANGTFIQETKESADYVLEVSTGAVGTNRYELMYGVPETSVPAVLTLGTATTIPEVPFIKRTDQKAQIKLTMWAYNKKTGAIIWQSGEKLKTASIRDRWIFGAGPFTKSSFNEKTQMGGDDVPFDDLFGQRIAKNEKPSVKTEAVYHELDSGAIDHLEEIRKEGLAALAKTDGGSTVSTGVTDKTPESDKKPATETKPEADKKPENPAPEPIGPDGRPPVLKAETITDDSAVKTAVKPETGTSEAAASEAASSKTSDAPPVPPAGTISNLSAPEPSGNSAAPSASPFLQAPTPTLDFGSVTLGLGETVVPKK